MDYDQTASWIQKHEGFSESIYLDSKGIPTVGYGVALTPGKKLPINCLFEMFNEAFRKAINDCRLCEMRFNVELDSVRRAAIINMCYCVGRKGTMAFKNMWAALQIGDYEKASTELLDSRWHRDLEAIRGGRNIETRTMELSRMIREGED